MIFLFQDLHRHLQLQNDINIFIFPPGPPSSSATSKWKKSFEMLRGGRKHRSSKENLSLNPPLTAQSRQKALSVDTIDYDGYSYTGGAKKSAIG